MTTPSRAEIGDIGSIRYLVALEQRNPPPSGAENASRPAETARPPSEEVAVPGAAPDAPRASTVSTRFRDFDAGSVMIAVIITLLVVIMIGGGLVIVNLGLLSKRREDRVGGRTPSDVGILRESVWPNEAPNRSVLPAMDETEDEALTGTTRILGESQPSDRQEVGTPGQQSITSRGMPIGEESFRPEDGEKRRSA